MTTLRFVKATVEMWEDAYEVFYRALKKLISEGKSNLFGGMTPNDVKASLEDGNSVFLVYRKGDQIPVTAISILHEKCMSEEYRGFLTEKSLKTKTAILNAVATRPELWGQGYAKQALKLLKEVLKEEGIEVLVGTYDPENRATEKDLHAIGTVYESEPFERTTPRGRVLKRKRFAVALN